MADTKAFNPSTGRAIKIDGRTYKRLYPTGKMWLDSQSDNPELRANANWYLEAAANPEKFGFKSLRGVRMSRTYDLNHTTPKKKGMTTLIDNPDRYANNPHLFDFRGIDNGDKIRKLPKWIRDRIAQQRKILHSELWAYIDKKYPLLSKQEKQEIVKEYQSIIPKPKPEPKPESKKIDETITPIIKETPMTDHQKRMALLDKKIAAVKEYRKNKSDYKALKATLDEPEAGSASVSPTTIKISDSTTPPGYKTTIKASKKTYKWPWNYNTYWENLLEAEPTMTETTAHEWAQAPEALKHKYYRDAKIRFETKYNL